MKIIQLWRYPGYLRKVIWLARARLLFTLQGIQVGQHLSLHGVPIITRYPGSVVTLGDRVNLCSSSRFTALGVARPVILRTLRTGATLAIGTDSGLSGTTICAARSVRIGERCLFGADVMITDTDFHPIAYEGRRYRSELDAQAEPVEIGDDVFVGARAIILRGVTVGEGSVVGAGSIVTRDIPAYSVCAGNPARVIRSLKP